MAPRLAGAYNNHDHETSTSENAMVTSTSIGAITIAPLIIIEADNARKRSISFVTDMMTTRIDLICFIR